MRSQNDKRTEINAVHADQLNAFFKRVGLADALAAGQLHCAICDVVLTADAVAAVRQDGDSMVFSCSRPGCVRTFS